MSKSVYYLLLVAIVAFSCSTTSIPSSSNAERYSEDLSIYRPKYDVNKESEIISSDQNVSQSLEFIEPEYDVTEELNEVLDSIDVLRDDVRYIDGYTVQVYYGTNSSEASLIKGKVKRLLPDSSPLLKYDEPNFRVKVGKFYSRLEAQQTYSALKAKFQSALVIPERIYIK
ncbi:MAG: hypothetical protein AAFN93_14610 [Bacteroidota bacterium]